MTLLAMNAILVRNGATYRVHRLVNGNVQLENTVTGEIFSQSLDQLLEEYAHGMLLVAPKSKQTHIRSSRDLPRSSGTPSMSGAAEVETMRRVHYIVTLEEQGAFRSGKSQLREAIREISASRKEERPPDVTTIYRWRKKFTDAQNDVRALISIISSRGGKGKPRTNPNVEAIISESIDTVYLTNRRAISDDVHEAVTLRIQRENVNRAEGLHLKSPGLRTIQRRIAGLPAFDVAVARYGLREARRRFSPNFVSRQVTRILEIAEIDHTLVDLMVVDQDRKVIGRPSITVILDRYSRCVLGYHLSLAGHRVEAVFEALRHAILPKTYLKMRYAGLGLVWDCYGWIQKLLMDNGREFHAGALTDALTRLGIVAEYARAYDPNAKAHVERFLKTYNYSFIHKLPGTTLGRMNDRIGYKPDEEACLTLEELDRATHVWITNKYHLRPHAGLGGRTPAEVWHENAAINPPELKMNADDLDIELCRLAHPMLQHYGIDLNTFRYSSSKLSILRKLLPSRSRVTVKWPWHDVGYIWVWDPIDEQYFKVPNADASYDGLTCDQAKVANRRLYEDSHQKRTRALASEVVREIAESAMADKQLAQRKRGARLSNRTSKQLHRDVTSEKVVLPNDCERKPLCLDQDSDIQPFEFDQAA